ncbi:MAG: DUF5681 domain-containing protein [Parvibaculaceae bacterium]
MSNNSRKKKTDSYEVGYGKPPKHSQYVKDESGNPSGRAKQSHDLDTAIAKQLQRQVTITEGGEQRKLRMVEALAMRITSDAAKGKPAAIREVKASIKRRQEIEKAESEAQTDDMSFDEKLSKIERIIEYARTRRAKAEDRQERLDAAKKGSDKQPDDDD